MSAVHWMGEEIEALARDLGGDTRHQIEDWVWHCGCRNRRPRYKAVLRLAIDYMRGVYLALQARDRLMCLLQNNGEHAPDTDDESSHDTDPQG